jgi:hypothetical protein
MKLQRLAAGLFLVLCFSTLSTQFAVSQSDDKNLPHVVSTETLDSYIGDIAFAISNNGDFVYSCAGMGSCWIWSRQTREAIESFYPGTDSYWSIDNSLLVTKDKDNNCSSDPKQYELVLFSTQSREISRHCSPESAYFYSWSPFNPSEFYGGSVLDLNTFQAESFSYPTTLDLSDLDHYQGYGNTFWDVSTQLPVGTIFLKIQNNNQLQFTQSEFHICTLDGEQCLPILDTLTVAPVDVFAYKLYKHWILWAGHASSEGQAISIQGRPWKINDTILYMTDFYTGSTHELFRFSSLGLTSQYISDMAWSPDGQTVGLALSNNEIDPALLPTLPPPSTHLITPSATPLGTPAPTPVLSTLPPFGTPISTPVHLPGLVLVHIVWPSIESSGT